MAKQTALFETAPKVPTAPAKLNLKRGKVPPGMEVATIEKGEFLAPIRIAPYRYPSLSQIIGERDRGRGVAFYDTMLGTDPDLAAFIRDLEDDVLHYTYTVTPYSPASDHVLHARAVEFGLRRLPSWQNMVRHALSAYPKGFAVFEKVYEVIEAGEWAGLVTFSALLDKPQRWFSFDLNRNLRFLTAANSFEGELVPQDKFQVVTFGTNSNPWGKAALDDVYWAWFLKHHGMEMWAIFMEHFASPTAVAKYKAGRDEKTNRENVDKALSVAMSFQTDQAVAVPEGMLLELLESKRNGTVSYKDYLDFFTEMESRLLTGQLLTSMGAEGGSHALGKVHEKRAANKTEMLAEFTSTDFLSQLGRELVVRNFGRQEGYPDVQILAKSPVALQADATLIQMHQANGFKLSLSHYSKQFAIVPPKGADDVLEPSAVAKPGQVLPINQALAAPAATGDARPHVVQLSAGRAMPAARERAEAQGRELEQIGKTAAKKARPAIRKAVKGLAGAVRKAGKKGLRSVTRAHVYRALPGLPGTHELGQALDEMLGRAGRLRLEAAPNDAAPPDISTGALLALVLQLMALADRVFQAKELEPEDGDAGGFADSLTDPDGHAVDEAAANLFEGVHSTNVANIATARLRQQLADPAFRRSHPYVMIVTHPDARPAHQVMNGFVLSAEDAQYSPFLSPYGFGCRCIPVALTREEAAAAGLTGAAPTGSLDEFLRGKGLTPNPSGFGYMLPNGQIVRPGGEEGFDIAYRMTDDLVQLDAVRTKAEELRAKDPEAWLALQKWLDSLFGVDILRQNPPGMGGA